MSHNDQTDIVDLRRQLAERTAERDEALAHKAAIAEVLEIIGKSMADARPVFERIVDSVARLFDHKQIAIFLAPGDGLLHLAARRGLKMEMLDSLYPLPFEQTAAPIVLGAKRQVYYADALNGPHVPESIRRAAQRTGNLSNVSTPMLWKGQGVGVIAVTREPNVPFSESELSLLRTFADQAVIAIENARLFNETQEALERQTASAEVLQVISSSPGDLKPVFDQMLAKAMRLCEAQCGFIYQMEQGAMRAVAEIGVPPAFAEYRRNNLHTGGAATPADVMRATRKPAHVHDARDSEPYRSGNPNAVAGVDLGGARTVLYVPMIRNDDIVGVINVYRQEVRPFTEEQISLLENFASQAVIAIENARLFNETRQALERQTATSEVLEVISRSPGDLQPVFKSMLNNALRICAAKFGQLLLFDGTGFLAAELYNTPADYAELFKRGPLVPGPNTGLGRLIASKEAIHIPDVVSGSLYAERDPLRIATVDILQARTLLAVPMLSDAKLVGAIIIYRQEVRPFSERQIELVTNFAAQAVIALENTRLLNELRQRTADLSKSLDDLRAAQDRLVQTEKLASLGQLTAGIAHEIKNPLNFVNNFSALSAELTDELNDVLKPVVMDGKVRREVDELTGFLKDNLEKVVQHGKRADSIVKNMLLHSREGSGERRSADVNALVDESLNLAYHGARAEKSGFNITLERRFDAGAGAAELFPQEITRALLNLISNGFYAATRRKAENGEAGFEPTLLAKTRDLGHAVEIRIRDNGTGIPPEVKEKMFNPFFTTKPAGEGTGLGLSMTHDIIVKQHGGQIEVHTEPGSFTEFTIILPRTGPR
jgi:two-component system NtrC family sensor kinase